MIKTLKKMASLLSTSRSNTPHITSYQFPITKEPHLATIRDKVRSSGLTSVRFITDNTLICCDFNEKKAYFAELLGNKLIIHDTVDTIVESGQSVETDLMDLSGDTFVVTNFYQGSLSIYKIFDKKISFIKEINNNDFVGAHGVRFIPGYRDLLWVTYCGKHNKCYQIVNLENGQIIHSVPLNEQAQDVAFIDGYAVCFARTHHIIKGVLKRRRSKKKPWKKTPLKEMYATAYLYRMPENLYKTPPTFISEWRGTGHIDATKEFNNLIYGANQYNECVDVFTIEANTIILEKSLKGFGMPHGLDINSKGLLAATNYKDQTLRTLQL